MPRRERRRRPAARAAGGPRRGRTGCASGRTRRCRSASRSRTRARWSCRSRSRRPPGCGGRPRESASGTKSANSGEPEVVTIPAVSSRSLIACGSPCIQPRRSPRASSASRADASAQQHVALAQRDDRVERAVAALDPLEAGPHHLHAGQLAPGDPLRERGRIVHVAHASGLKSGPRGGRMRTRAMPTPRPTSSTTPAGPTGRTPPGSLAVAVDVHASARARGDHAHPGARARAAGHGLAAPRRPRAARWRSRPRPTCTRARTPSRGRSSRR